MKVRLRTRTLAFFICLISSLTVSPTARPQGCTFLGLKCLPYDCGYCYNVSALFNCNGTLVIYFTTSCCTCT